MSKSTYPLARDNKIIKITRHLFNFWARCILSMLVTFSLPCLSDTIKEETTSFSMSVSYTTINEHGKETLCTISSNDRIEKLQALKSTDCKLPMSIDPNDQSVILISHSPYHKTKQILLTTRNLLMWSYMAVHVYKLLDSGNILWTQQEACPCSGKLMDISNKPDRLMTKGFFFTYYLLSLGYHGWRYIQSYINPDASAPDNKTSEFKNDEPAWSDTLNNFISRVSEYPYAGQILTLALDSAALKWDCRCPGYFTDSKGGLYFNGHLWMLLLNVAIFTTDLAIDYL
ncbi:hypothetical protein [Salinisphaera sp. G21_0]|uniref:hypothetical protein n=1 Tax=Salinisphaera sp. G21_0 TaxID=2821094 RepID=UPI001ADB0385|nr:hypothetical protein [Salinisphaera sp. G21_0]MBO9481938.1 hypothetical protein [Salinisphaera sp. G21_0]